MKFNYSNWSEFAKNKNHNTHFRGGGLQSIPRGKGEVPSCLCFGGLLCIWCIIQSISLPLSNFLSLTLKSIPQNSLHTITENDIQRELGFLMIRSEGSLIRIIIRSISLSLTLYLPSKFSISLTLSL